MTCTQCVLKQEPVHSSYASILLGYSDPSKAIQELDTWASKQFVPALTHYCEKCHQITRILQDDYPRTPCAQLIIANHLRQNYLQMIPRGQSKQTDCDRGELTKK